jgi:nitrogen fixation negative regulator NifL
MLDTLANNAWALLFTGSLDPMVIVDAGGAVVRSNPAAHDLFGYTEEQFKGLSVDCLLPERYRARHAAFRASYMLDAAKRPMSARAPLYAIRSDGTEFLVEISLNPLVDGLVLASIQDVTERRRDEDALRKFRRVVEQATSTVIITDARGIIEYVNPRFTEISGYSTDEAVGKHSNLIKSGLMSPETYRDLWSTIAAGAVWRGELLNRRKDGSTYWDFVVISPMRDDSRRITHFVSIQQDITERKKAEEALRISEERFRATFEQAAVGIAHIAPDGRWLRVNRKLCEIVGYSHDELLDTTFQAITHPDDLDADAEAVRRLLTGEGVTHQMEKRYIRPDKSITWINLTVALVRRSDGDPDYFISVVEDISARKRTEAMLQELQAEMDQVMQFHVASQTIAAIAHELNTPLHAVCNYAEAALRLLIAGNPEPDLLRHALISAAEQSQRAGTVVRELLAFMKKGEVDTEPLDLNQVVRNVLARIDREGYGGFEVGLDLEPNLAPVAANRLQVEKVLTNLIENGVEAMHEAGVDTRAIVVKVRTCPDRGDMARVIVQDSGPGIDEKTMHRIFDPFYSTKTKGLGMGLAISRAIVESHGGQLWCESAHGAGASFHFTLPLAP